MKKLAWKPVVVFYLIALGISGPLFYWRTILDWKGFVGPDLLKTVSYMWGPGIAGIVCYALYRRMFKKEITVLGRSAVQSIAMWVVPFLLLAALGLREPGGSIDHVTPLTLIGLGLLTIWGEEVGWRWFLQDYLAPLPRLRKYVLIGVLWELWHLRFLGKLGQPILSILLTSLVVMVVTVLLSIAIGYVTDRTRSLAFAAALHAWVNLCLEFPQMHTYIAAGAMAVLCAVFCFSGKDRRGRGNESRVGSGLNASE
jgi:membrane protease YdiL (CAAX protease family)